MSPARAIIIRSQTAGRFDVEIEPPLDGDGLRQFETYRAARGHASGLRLVHRWQIRDEVIGL